MSNDNKTLADVQPGGRVRLGDADLSALAASIGEVAHRLSTYMPHLSEWADRARDCRKAAEVLSALAARQPVRIYGCCAQPEGELHTAECPNLRHLAARQPVGALPQGCDACDQTGIRQNDEGRNICCPDCDLGRACAGDTRQPVRRSFQAGVAEWMGQCFLPSLYSDMTERGDRLLEEVLELLQAHDYDSARVATLVDYVFGRPVGEPAQEVGGVMVTLAGYCWVAGLDMHAAGDAELARINQPDVMAKIRAKQEAKNALHFDTPLPGDPAVTIAPKESTHG